MEAVAAEDKIDFIINTGDNYYYPGGANRVPNTKWEIHWANIYKKLPHLK